MADGLDWWGFRFGEGDGESTAGGSVLTLHLEHVTADDMMRVPRAVQRLLILNPCRLLAFLGCRRYAFQFLFLLISLNFILSIACLR